jgi:brefeldin A-resistance guanine nucleotide exchange factor 1
MHALVRTVFSRLHSLDPIVAEKKLENTDEVAQEGEIRMTVSTNQIPSGEGLPDSDADIRSGRGDFVAPLASQEPVIASRSECAYLPFF